METKNNLPIWASIEITDICNLECPTCPRTEIIKRGDTLTGYLTIDKLDIIKSQLPDLKEIKFQGLGEPFLTPKAHEKFHYLKKLYPNTQVLSITNAAWKDNVEVEKILQNVDYLYISIDGHDYETFEKFRLKASFEQMVRNVKRIKKLAPKNLKISINSTFNYETAEDLYKCIILAKALGIDNIRFNLIQNWITESETDTLKSKRRDFINNISLSKLETENLIASVRKMSDLAKLLDVKAQIIGNSDFKISDCHWGDKMMYMTQKGEILPCGMRCDPKYSFGNIFKTNIEEIWNSDKMVDFREMKKSDTPPGICMDCPYLVNSKILKLLNDTTSENLKSDFLYHKL